MSGASNAGRQWTDTLTQARDVIDQFLEDAHAIHPGHVTTSGLLSRLEEAGYVVREVGKG